VEPLATEPATEATGQPDPPAEPTGSRAGGRDRLARRAGAASCRDRLARRAGAAG
jgi:hypothetical protein